MYVEHVRLNALLRVYSTAQSFKHSINNVKCNSKSSNKEFIWFSCSIYKVLRIKLPKNSIYNYFELNCTTKVWIEWNFELTGPNLYIVSETRKNTTHVTMGRVQVCIAGRRKNVT